MRRRVQEVARCREIVSGGSPEQLLQKEIHHLSTSERKALLTEAGITVHIPADQGLAMKANLALPWKKMRDIRRYMYVYVLYHVCICNVASIRANKSNGSTCTLYIHVVSMHIRIGTFVASIIF